MYMLMLVILTRVLVTRYCYNYYQLDDLSHKGSGYSLEMAVNSTPKSGSLENLAGGEFLRRSDVPPAKPPRTITNPASEPVMDEWEQKLYGKYGKGQY